MRRARARRSSRPSPTEVPLRADVRARQHERQRPRPERGGRRSARSSNRARVRAASSVAVSTGSARSRGRSLGLEQAAPSRPRRCGVGADAVDGVRREHDQLSRERTAATASAIGSIAMTASAPSRSGRVRSDRARPRPIHEPGIRGRDASDGDSLRLTDLDDDRAPRPQAPRPPARTAARTTPMPPARASMGSASTSRGSAESSCSSTYGGLLTTRSTEPRRSAGTGSSRSPCATSTSSPERIAFSSASATASARRSIARTTRIRPLVLDRERDRAGPRSDVDHDRRRHAVEGRERVLDDDLRLRPGMNTPGRTVSVSRRNGCSPVRCCSGTPTHRWHSARPNRLASAVDRPCVPAYIPARSMPSTEASRISAVGSGLSTSWRAR